MSSSSTHVTLPENYTTKVLNGELEFIIKDVRGRVIETIREHNIIKIFAKEILAHQLAPRHVWDPTAGTGAGAWVDSGLDPFTQYAPRYIAFGAAFDANHFPLNANDPRYYQIDPGSGQYVPIQLGVGAEYDGGLVNAIPISEPSRPLKRIERIYYEPSYQPAGTPLLQPDVRAMNNVLVLETTLRKEEYNGFGLVASDYFTVTEVALIAGKELGHVGACESPPKDLFLEGHGGTRTSILARASGTATINLDPSESPTNVDVIREGDQLKIVAVAGTDDTTNILNQITPYYLVISKPLGSNSMVLDRVPVDSSGVALSGTIGVFKSGMRIFSHRILRTPFKKSIDFEVVCRWRLIMS